MTAPSRLERRTSDADESGWRRRSARAWAAVALSLAAITAAVVAVDRLGGTGDVIVRASSATEGTDPNDLVRAARDLDEPARAPERAIDEPLGEPDYAAWANVDPVWVSRTPAKGSWLTLEWHDPAAVSHIRLDGAGGPAHAYSAAVVTFDNGASVWVTPDRHGNVSVDIERVWVTSAEIRFVDGAPGSEAVALRALSLDDSGSIQSGGAAGAPAPRVSSAQAGDSAAALADGSIEEGDIGATWSPDTADQAPWAALSWDEATAVASVSIAGSTDGGDPMHGTLVFSDGSTIPVSGVASGTHPLTTIAITPRRVTWLRFEIAGDAAPVGELRAYPAGSTPPRWPTTRGVEVDAPDGPGCTASSAAVGTSSGAELALVCPAIGTAVSGDTTVVVSAAPGSSVTAAAWDPRLQSITDVAESVADSDGRAVLMVELDRLQHGPVALKVTAPSAAAPLYPQLYNVSGVAVTSDGFAPAGMTLQYEDDFSEPLSLTQEGHGATYSATKPDAGGRGEFGDAVFADPAWGTDSIGTLKEEYLRIKVEPLGTRDDPWGWERQHTGGILSSARVGGSGFSAQYGYFEARILAPAAAGSWPAFWMLDTESARAPADAAGEIDAVELYGHNPTGSCHTAHNWLSDSDAVGVDCFHDNGMTDWALTWHTYGVHVRPDGADMFIDGRLITSWSNLELDALPYFFLIDLALGGGWPVHLEPLGEEIEMYVDWVRVYT
ncbi:family 16 glycosylhydrolase [Demequina sp. NBRC 110052]|uniref:glycoside hydrolase family 16 protein n=1 Tax=Demequina sp. NBRC 110052 TaxID=1570341 RepID=UPI000A011D14|nr:glycoside hydrolase family 16 protein [Demequina sp. NBRC 110052]